jgi:hypothetical protein
MPLDTPIQILQSEHAESFEPHLTAILKSTRENRLLGIVYPLAVEARLSRTYWHGY